MGVLGPVSQKILSPLVILSMEKTMVTMVISDLSPFLDLRFFEKLNPHVLGTCNRRTFA